MNKTELCAAADYVAIDLCHGRKARQEVLLPTNNRANGTRTSQLISSRTQGAAQCLFQGHGVTLVPLTIWMESAMFIKRDQIPLKIRDIVAEPVARKPLVAVVNVDVDELVLVLELIRSGGR